MSNSEQVSICQLAHDVAKVVDEKVKKAATTPTTTTTAPHRSRLQQRQDHYGHDANEIDDDDNDDDLTSFDNDQQQGQGQKSIFDIDHDQDEDDIVDRFYSLPSDPSILSKKPWQQDARYFETVYVSSVAALKMSTHARSGGSIEIMGMLTGKVFSRSIVVLDCYPLPVEGTETRVNAQSEAYEFMVQYLDTLKKSIGRDENIIGWYHSHPGYGCWLSGIDVATQELNQNFQDPYLAIVVDPERTLANQKLEIGAFRTFPKNSNVTVTTDKNNKLKGTGKVELKNMSDSKAQDYGVHHDRYYSLDVKFFQTRTDKLLLNNCINKNQTSELINSNELGRTTPDRTTIQKMLKVSSKLDDYKIPNVVINNNNSTKNTTRKLNNNNSNTKDIHMGLSPMHEVLSSRGANDHESSNGSGSRVDHISDNEMVEDSDYNNTVAGSQSSISASEVEEEQEEEEEEEEEETEEGEDSHIHEPNKSAQQQASAPAAAAAAEAVPEVNEKMLGAVSAEITRIFKEPPITEISADAGDIAVTNMIKLIKLKLQRDLFG